ncbi:hypothetical protein OKC48_23790 [Methylorubrum extorquens]|uniref:hypothetical protein n=1 Tax=Methylorubrum extorquens TaxID=408 RepID=UPI0022386C49|nr:hypothetical protein [Methylorubrum extorquens]UYW26255.1 hypothetical protein OKC48_23790 [Methylorubrum extorquens]
MNPAGPLHLGVDPGKNGAWALLDRDGRLVDADHLPLDAEGEIDAAALASAWRGLGAARATVERVGSMGVRDAQEAGTLVDNRRGSLGVLAVMDRYDASSMPVVKAAPAVDIGRPGAT